MNFDPAAFSVGFGVILTGFFFAWVVGLAAKAMDYGGE